MESDLHDCLHNHVIWGAVESSEDSSSTKVIKRVLTNQLNQSCRVAFQPTSSSCTSEFRSVGESPSARAQGLMPVGLLNADDSSAQVAMDEMIEKVLTRHQLWSMGSATHREQRCKPCNYVRAPKGCKNGLQCEFCHLPHTESHIVKAKKLSMSQRLHCKQIAIALEEIYTTSPEVYQDVALYLSTDSAYLRNIVQNRIMEGKMTAWETQTPSTVLSMAQPAAALSASAQLAESTSTSSGTASGRNKLPPMLTRRNIQSL